VGLTLPKPASQHLKGYHTCICLENVLKSRCFFVLDGWKDLKAIFVSSLLWKIYNHLNLKKQLGKKNSFNYYRAFDSLTDNHLEFEI